MTTLTAPSDPITWTAGDEEYSLDLSTRTAEIIIDRLGWCSARVLYTLRAARLDGCTSWRIMELDGSSREHTPNDSALVIEVEHQISDEWDEQQDGAVSIRTWFIPRALAASPRTLVGASQAKVRRALLIDTALSTPASHALPLTNPFDAELAPTSVASIPPSVKDHLRTVAEEAAHYGGFVILEPVAAAYLYSEIVGSNLNQTVWCTWIWRLGFPTDHGGLLIAQTCGNNVDASESDGPSDWGDSRAWLAQPADLQRVHSTCPGIPLHLWSEDD